MHVVCTKYDVYLAFEQRISHLLRTCCDTRLPCTTYMTMYQTHGHAVGCALTPTLWSSACLRGLSSLSISATPRPSHRVLQREFTLHHHTTSRHALLAKSREGRRRGREDLAAREGGQVGVNPVHTEDGLQNPCVCGAEGKAVTTISQVVAVGLKHARLPAIVDGRGTRVRPDGRERRERRTGRGSGGRRGHARLLAAPLEDQPNAVTTDCARVAKAVVGPQEDAAGPCRNAPTRQALGGLEHLRAGGTREPGRHLQRERRAADLGAVVQHMQLALARRLGTDGEANRLLVGLGREVELPRRRGAGLRGRAEGRRGTEAIRRS